MHECPDCGALYDVKSVKLTFRDKDSFECECGKVLAEWNGSRIQQFRLIKHGRTKADA